MKYTYELSNLGQNQTQEMHRDRIARVYQGMVSDEVTQARAKRRIDWLTEQIPGGRIFDVGCSEGILAVKLAEKGCQVDAIDIFPEVVDFAREFAAEQIPEKASLVDFKVQDIFSLEQIDPVYDVVVLGEVIEHVYEPANMLKRAAMAAKLQGLVIVTTPFGYSPAPDHHQTFLLKNFLEFMPTILRCEYLDIVDSYIRFIGRKICDPAADEIPEVMSFADGIDLDYILSITEKATLQSQKFLRGVFENRSSLLEKARAAADTLRDQRDANNSMIADLKKQLGALRTEQAKKGAEDTADKVRSDTAALVSETVDSLTLQLSETKTQLRDRENLLMQLHDELAEVRQEAHDTHAVAANKERELQQLLAESREELTIHLRSSEAALQQMQDQLAATRQEARDTHAAAANKERELQQLLAESRKEFNIHLRSGEAALKQMRDELAATRQEARDAHAVAANKERELQQLLAESREEFRSHLRSSEAALKQMRDEFAATRQEARGAQAAAASKERELQQLLAESRAENRSSMDALGAARDANALDREALAATARDLEIRGAQITQMKAELTKRRRKAGKLETANIEMRALLADRDAALETLRREQETAKAEMILLTRSYERLKLSEGDLKLVIEAMQKSSAGREMKLNRAITELQDKLAAAAKERDALSDKVGLLKAAYDDRAALLERARANSVRLREQRDAASALLLKKNSWFKRLGQRWASRVATNSRLRSGVRRYVPAGVKNSITHYLYGAARPSAPTADPAMLPPAAAAVETKASQPPLPAPAAIDRKTITSLVPENATYDCALICHSYPGGRREYGGGFVHSRIAAYAKAGLSTLVVETSNQNRENWFNRYEGIDCLRTTSNDLAEVLRKMQKRYKTLLMHSPTPDIVDVLPRRSGPAIAWLHGFEVRDYRRLYFNFTTADRETRRLSLDALNATRFESARRLFSNPAIHKVFVSEFIKRVAQSDVGVEANPAHVIPNFIDTEHFGFEQKTAAASKNVLLIRSFAARNYANDIATEAIALLSGRPGFQAFNFTVCGFGGEFETLTSPLRGLANVTVREGVLNAAEMKNEHDKHGIFLAPSRFDTQGVTLGEAMSSGMACITNRVCAIPEYCDEDSAVLVRPDDPRAFAEAIWALGHDPDRVARLSKAAAERARAQCAYAATIARELDLIRSLDGSNS